MLTSTRAGFTLQCRFQLEARLSDEKRDRGCFIESVTVVEDDLLTISESIFAIEAEAEFSQREFGREYGVIYFFYLRWLVSGLGPYPAFKFGLHHVG